MTQDEIYTMFNEAYQKNMNTLANIFCGKCGGARQNLVSQSAIALNRWWVCECTTPARSWAARTWIQRANAWLRGSESHDLAIIKDKTDGTPGAEVTIHYLFGTLEEVTRGKKPWINAKTLSQMETIPFVNSAEFVMVAFDEGEKISPVPRRKNFLHEMGR